MDPRAEHVWVTDVQVWGDRQAPGLLLGWERRADGWWGFVITAQAGIDAHGAGPYVRQLWVPASAISPATSGGAGTATSGPR